MKPGKYKVTFEIELSNSDDMNSLDATESVKDMCQEMIDNNEFPELEFELLEEHFPEYEFEDEIEELSF